MTWKSKFRNGQIPTEDEYAQLIALAESNSIQMGAFGKQLNDAQSKDEARSLLGVVDNVPAAPEFSPTYAPNHCRIGQILIQWGTVNLGVTYTTITFPIPFSQAGTIQATRQNSSGTGAAYARFISNSQAIIGNNGSTNIISWFALGMA